MIKNILNNIIHDDLLNIADLTRLLALEPSPDLDLFYQAADQVRECQVGNHVHLRGLIEFSNVCRKNCSYCGIRRDNNRVARYRMTVDEILETIINAERLGYRSVVLQSGEDPYYTTKLLAGLLSQIKQKTSLAVTLSIGERKREDYLRFFAAGADRYLIRFETSNPDLYQRLHPDSKYGDRFLALQWLRDIGYQVGSGVMVGLPGQTLEDLARDIITFKELDLDMVGIGPFISHPQTPLAGSENGSVDLTLKVIALTRIVTRNTHIPATTALATLRPANGREQGLLVGANVLMPNVTPVKYRALYQLYPDKICINESADQCRGCIAGRVTSVGRVISNGRGDSLKQTACNSN